MPLQAVAAWTNCIVPGIVQCHACAQRGRAPKGKDPQERSLASTRLGVTDGLVGIGDAPAGIITETSSRDYHLSVLLFYI